MLLRCELSLSLIARCSAISEVFHFSFYTMHVRWMEWVCLRECVRMKRASACLWYIHLFRAHIRRENISCRNSISHQSDNNKTIFILIAYALPFAPHCCPHHSCIHLPVSVSSNYKYTHIFSFVLFCLFCWFGSIHLDRCVPMLRLVRRCFGNYMVHFNVEFFTNVLNAFCISIIWILQANMELHSNVVYVYFSG